MKRSIIVLHLILFFLVESCSYGQQVERKDAIAIETVGSRNLFDAFPDSTSLDFNEMPNGKIPGTVSKLIVRNDTLFVLDSFKSKAFFAYASDGTPLFEYSKQGEGPDEYIFLSDLDVDDKNIYLLDSESHKILLLNKNGKFEKKVDSPAHTAHIKPFYDAKSKKASYYFDMYTPEKARLIRQRGRKNDTLMITPDGMSNFNYSAPNSFQSDKLNTEILYMPSYSSCIYKFNENGEPQEYINLDFKGLMPDLSFFKSLKGRRSEDKFKLIKDGFAYYFSFDANSTHILVGFVYEDKHYLCFINKSSHATDIFDMPTDYSIRALTDDNLYLYSKNSDNLTIVNISSISK